MIWQNPYAFWLLATVPLFIALFFYRRRLPVIIVPSLQTWEALGEPVKTQSWRNLLRRLPLLLLQLLIVMLVVLMGANPVYRTPPQSSVIIVLDCSATMLSQTGNGSTRFDLARSKCHEIIAANQGRTELILSTDSPKMLTAATEPLESSLDRLTPIAVDGRIGDAIQLARSVVGQRTDVEVVAISDFCGQQPELLAKEWKNSSSLKLIQVGEDRPDAGFVSAAITQEDTGQIILRGQLAAHGMAGKSVAIDLSNQGQRLSEAHVQLMDGIIPFEFPVNADSAVAKNSVLELRMHSDDALALNNTLRLRNGVRRSRIAIVSSGPSGLQPLISSAGNADVIVLSPEQIQPSAEYDLIVAERTVLPRSAPKENARYLFVGCVDSFGWLKRRGMLAGGNPSSWSPSHPVLRDVRPETLPIRSVIDVLPDVATSTSTILESDGLPLIMYAYAGPRQSSQALYLLFDPFSLKDSLAVPVIILNAVDFLTSGDVQTKPYLLTGDAPVLAKVGTNINVIDPSGQPVPMVVRGNDIVLSRLLNPGDYRIHTDTEGWTLPVNYASAAASKPLPVLTATEVHMVSAAGYLVTPGQCIAGLTIAIIILEFMLVIIGKARV